MKQENVFRLQRCPCGTRDQSAALGNHAARLHPQRSGSAKPQNPCLVRGWPGQAVRRILVPLDLSPGATAALELATGLAHQCGAALTLLHVIDISAQPSAEAFRAADKLMLRLWHRGLAQTKLLAKSLAGQLKVDTAVVEGLPSEQILHCSTKYDLIVLGPKKTGSMWRVFSKHTARRVMVQAHCPVLVANGGIQRDSSRHDNEAYDSDTNLASN